MRKLSLKIILFLSFFTLGLIGCGKKAEDVEKAGIQQHAQEINSQLLSINYQHSAFSSSLTTIPRNANFKILEFISFESSYTIEQPLQIFYNFIPEPHFFEFRCIYTPDNEAKRFFLSQCFNFAGSYLGKVLGIDFMLDQGKAILVQSHEVNTFEALIQHHIDWK